MDVTTIALSTFSNQCLKSVGVPENEAAIITKTMVEADARGIHSHGFMRLSTYIKRIQHGFIRPSAEFVVKQENETTAVIDGCFSAGQVTATRAMELAIQKATEKGLGAVSVGNSNHFGIAAYYAEMASKNNMVGIVMSNTAPLMPPIGGAEKVLGNNPLAISAPTENDYPLVIDMALSNVALGKILYAKSKNESIPMGWGLDKNGDPTTDPQAVLNGGFISAVGGPKGFGLALMIELLTGVLSGGSFSKQIPSMYDLTQKQSIGHFMLAINVESFMPIQEFKNRVTLLSSFVKDALKASDVKEIYLPGEIEYSLRENRLQQGVPMNESVLEELKAISNELDVPFVC